MNQDFSKKIQEIQILEQNLQTILMQKQNMTLEINEVLNAMQEIKSSPNEVYQMLSGIMIKSSVEKVRKELEEKKKIFELRISSIEKQEKIIEDKIQKLRDEMSSSLSIKKD